MRRTECFILPLTHSRRIFHVNFSFSSIFSASLVRKLIKKFNPARDEKNKFISSPETLRYIEMREEQEQMQKYSSRTHKDIFYSRRRSHFNAYLSKAPLPFRERVYNSLPVFARMEFLLFFSRAHIWDLELLKAFTSQIKITMVVQHFLRLNVKN